MRKSFVYFVGFAVAVATLTVQARAQRGGTAPAPPADLVLTNGRIVTVDDAMESVLPGAWKRRLPRVFS